ncbi:MAG: H-NS histone family protein [Rhizobiales bacterium]|nr:H-NS histone family protein [Hyphomicrobiales bacterium]
MRTMDERSLTEMAADELWDLHQSIVAILASKLETQKSELDKRLARLHANAVLDQVVEPARRPYPAVTPKFRNPAQPDQTWSGRGKRPRWVTELLNAGMSIRDFQISEVTTSQI